MYTLSINREAAKKVDHLQEARLAQAKRFRSLYRSLGYTAATLAKFLQVSEASVYRWQRDGNVPTLVLRFLRLLSFQELPGRTWEGWHFSRNTLWSPEGHGFNGKDFAWLNLTLRRATMFTVLYHENKALRSRLAEVGAQLVDAETRVLTAQSRVGLLELAVTGAMWGQQSSGLERVSSHRPLNDRAGVGGGDEGADGKSRPAGGDVLVTRHQLADFDHVASKSLIS